MLFGKFEMKASITLLLVGVFVLPTVANAQQMNMPNTKQQAVEFRGKVSNKENMQDIRHPMEDKMREVNKECRHDCEHLIFNPTDTSEVCIDKCSNLGPFGYHPLTKDEQKTQSKMCRHDCLRKSIHRMTCEDECQFVPLLGYHPRTIPNEWECNAIADICGGYCTRTVDEVCGENIDHPNLYKGDCSVYMEATGSLESLSVCEHNQYHKDLKERLSDAYKN